MRCCGEYLGYDVLIGCYPFSMYARVIQETDAVCCQKQALEGYDKCERHIPLSVVMRRAKSEIIEILKRMEVAQ